MNEMLRAHADQIIREALAAVQPGDAVHRALKNIELSGRVLLVAAGKAAWQMADRAIAELGDRIERGIVVTKYGHSRGQLSHCELFEAGHPLPDEASVTATNAVLRMTSDLTERDTVLFLLSGGASALFEAPLIDLAELQDLTEQLLASGAGIEEINTIRKRLSRVKGGRFAEICVPARVETIVLSDVIGDPLDMIASGPACPDRSTTRDALSVAERYGLRLSQRAQALLRVETPKALDNVNTQIAGNVRGLCKAAVRSCQRLGYETVLLTDRLCCQAKEAGSVLASIAKTHAEQKRRIAFVAGGETVVVLTGKGKGGRNQELALAAAPGIAGLPAAVFSLGSDGTDGPTDAAGGYVDGDTYACLREKGISIEKVLQANDSYYALQLSGGLIRTGPTGTNVNDVAVALIDSAEC